MIYALITVRSKSTRLPQKCFLPFGDCTVLEHVVRRALHNEIIPIICTTTNKEDFGIIDIARKLQVKYYCGSEINKLNSDRRHPDSWMKFV